MVCREVRTTYHILVSAAMRQINLIGMHNKLIPGPAKYALQNLWEF